MISLVSFFLILLVSPLKSKSRLEAENAALRHQLIVLRRKASARVQLTNGDRLFLVLLYRWAFCRLQRLRHEPIGAHAAGLARADEAALFEHVEMLRERAKRHVEGARQLAHGRGAGAEPAQHGAPRGIAQRAKDPVKLHLLVRHMPNHTAGQCLSEWRGRRARLSLDVRFARSR